MTKVQHKSTSTAKASSAPPQGAVLKPGNETATAAQREEPLDRTARRDDAESFATQTRPSASHAAHQPRPGAMARLQLEAWDPTAYLDMAVHDIDEGLGLLQRLVPAVTCYGSARTARDSADYALALETGRLLAHRGVPIREGGGPGIMLAVPEGFKLGLLEVPAAQRAWMASLFEGLSPDAQPGDIRTQAFNIFLPKEQKIEGVNDLHEELYLFALRKLTLQENSRGQLFFPGGFGTMDELFECWWRGAAERHNDPMILAGSGFYAPLLEALRQVAVSRRQLVAPSELSLPRLLDDPHLIVQEISRTEGVRGFDQDPGALLQRLWREIPVAARALDRRPPAISVLGADSLQLGDPTLDALRAASRTIARASVPLRIDGDGPVAAAAAAGALSAGGRVQRYQLEGTGHTGGLPGVRPTLTVQEPLVHAELMSTKCQGLVALPGDLRTLSHVFSILVRIQCHKIPRVPVVLVGRDYWKPIMDAIAAVMLNHERQAIDPADLELFRIVDSADEITAALRQGGALPA